MRHRFLFSMEVIKKRPGAYGTLSIFFKIFGYTTLNAATVAGFAYPVAFSSSFFAASSSWSLIISSLAWEKLHHGYGITLSLTVPFAGYFYCILLLSLRHNSA